MSDQELPFDIDGQQRKPVAGGLILMDVSAPGSYDRLDWGVSLHWRFPNGEHVTVTGWGNSYKAAHHEARNLLYVKFLSWSARQAL